MKPLGSIPAHFSWLLFCLYVVCLTTGGSGMSTVRLTVTARATDSNLCYAHIKLMQQKAHIELMLLALKDHTSIFHGYYFVYRWCVSLQGGGSGMSTVRLTVTARATDSNLCYAHIKLMQQKAHIELMLLAFKGHTSRPPSVAIVLPVEPWWP